jgi:hypothetical protein
VPQTPIKQAQILTRDAYVMLSPYVGSFGHRADRQCSILIKRASSKSHAAIAGLGLH